MEGHQGRPFPPRNRPPVRDYRYKHVLIVWQAGKLESFARIFEVIPKTVVADDMGMHYHSFVNKLNRPELWNVKQLIRLQGLTGINLSALVELIAVDLNAKTSTNSQTHQNGG
ncbi:hypothetical protein EDB95_4996 [Dinghuibacter silviterrae]|uniref:Uncharacterized protein n=2 Tax=Dinghuibacter silviterrae TaxID=1539049 RepID=A0A4R8DIM0_9BACT|nr:hypothetical protein EDB95_4996 [Dinghuibacter silviterrae]